MVTGIPAGLPNAAVVVLSVALTFVFGSMVGRGQGHTVTHVYHRWG